MGIGPAYTAQGWCLGVEWVPGEQSVPGVRCALRTAAYMA
jgi:hypothetical protein